MVAEKLKKFLPQISYGSNILMSSLHFDVANKEMPRSLIPQQASMSGLH